MTKDSISGGVFLVFAAMLGFYATELDVGTAAAPGPGMYPLLLAVAIGVLSVFLIAAGLRNRGDSIAPAGYAGDVVHRKQVLFAMAVLIAYVVLLSVIGLAASSVLFLAALFWLGGMRDWKQIAMLAIVLGVGTEAACRLIGIPPPEAILVQMITGT